MQTYTEILQLKLWKNDKKRGISRQDIFKTYLYPSNAFVNKALQQLIQTGKNGLHL